LESQANDLITGDSITVSVGWAEAPSGAVLPQVWERDFLGEWTRTQLLPPPEFERAALLGVVDVGGGAGVMAQSVGCVGWSVNRGGSRHATLWTSEDSMQTWTAEDLGVLPGYTHSEANGLATEYLGNNIIVGTSYNTPSDRVATLWVKNAITEMYDLNDVIVGTQPDLVLRTATAVSGNVRDNIAFTYIVGWGVDPLVAMGPEAVPGDPHAWLLTNDLVITGVGETPPRFDPALIVAYPNPFASGTWISYTLPHSGPVRLSVYDVAGRRVATLVNAFQEGGEHTLTWNGRRANGSALASGIYFVRLDTGGQMATRKIVLLR
jgi:hypothetical protein